MSSSRISWILVGAPNSGKTSLFNQLTKSRKEVMNYPGSTVKAFHATTHIEETDVQIVDTPGVYDLDKNSLEVQEFLNTLAANPGRHHTTLYTAVLYTTRAGKNSAAIASSIRVRDGSGCFAFVTFSILSGACPPAG